MTRAARYIFLLLSLIGGSSGLAQDFIVNGKFLADSIKVGEEIRFTLAARYPSNFTILFPDSTSSFHPFEFVRKKYVPTKTRGSISYDSVIYTFVTFDVSETQSLTLPVHAVHQSDCTQHFSRPDTILLRSVIADLPDSVSLNSLPLKETISFEPIPYQFNYGNAIIIIGIVAVIALSGWVVFGKKIKRHFWIRKLQQNHARFIQDYDGNLQKMKETASVLAAESTVTVWKKYMEKLEATPFTKLTTRETIRLLNDESLSQNLHSIDRAIYGNHAINEQSFQELKDYAEGKFQKKLEEVKHG